MHKRFIPLSFPLGLLRLLGVLGVLGIGALPTSAWAQRAYRDVQEFPASGFMIEPLLGGSATITSAVAPSPFIIVPSLRLGAMLRPLAIAANVSYFSDSTLTGGYNGTNVITIGPDIMPFVWQSLDGHARLYLLFGFNLGAIFQTNRDTELTGGLTFGVGGHYFLHPHFALGVEIGSRTQFYQTKVVDGTQVNAISTLYAALSGTFVVGR